MPSWGIFEILEEAEKAKTREKKIAILREHRSKQLMDIILGAYDPRVQWLLPKGRPPFRPLDPEGTEIALLSQTRTLYLYVKDGNGPDLTQGKREQLFHMLLEAVHPKDAEILLAMKEKSLPYPSLTKELMAEAFPGTIAGMPQIEPRSQFQDIPVPDSPKTKIAAQDAPKAGKRGRGRPKGSKNKKPKTPTQALEEALAAVEGSNDTFAPPPNAKPVMPVWNDVPPGVAEAQNQEKQALAAGETLQNALLSRFGKV